MDNMKTPEECENLAEIRREIDRLDQHLIGTLAERFKRRWRIRIVSKRCSHNEDCGLSIKD
jgi:hypothetical protein